MKAELISTIVGAAACAAAGAAKGASIGIAVGGPIGANRRHDSLCDCRRCDWCFGW